MKKAITLVVLCTLAALVVVAYAKAPASGTEQALIALDKQWGAAGSPYYEKAMTMRAIENAIYFASVNYAQRFQESATSLIAPSGQCQAYLPYGQEGVLVQAINVEEATGLLATRYAAERYQECRLE